MTETAVLLDLLCHYFSRFVVLADAQLTAVALWTLHTYTYDVGDTTPYLVVTSAEKRSGKTRLLECIASVAHKPLTAAALTEATLFRIVSEWKPTLLIDETDTIFRENRGGPSERQEGLRAILNAGYRRGTKIPRMAPNGEPLLFDVYGPKVLAGIGHLPETIEDRGLSIRLTRRGEGQEIERFRFRTGLEEGGVIRDEIDKWKDLARIRLMGVTPPMPEALDDRAQDAYEGLIALADMAGEEWSQRGREALCELRAVESMARESLGMRVIRDLGLVLPHLQGERVATVELLDWLYRDGEEPYLDWWGESSGKKAARRLALTLAEYDVRPDQYKEGGEKKRGYKVEELGRICALYGGFNTVHTVLSLNDAGLRDTQHGTGEGEGYRVESADLQGSTESTVLFPYAAEHFLLASDNSVSQSLPSPGSTEWLGQASMDELRAWAEGLDTDDPPATLAP